MNKEEVIKILDLTFPDESHTDFLEVYKENKIFVVLKDYLNHPEYGSIDTEKYIGNTLSELISSEIEVMYKGEYFYVNDHELSYSFKTIEELKQYIDKMQQ